MRRPRLLPPLLLRPALATMAMIGIAGCVSFGPKVPPTLMTLTPTEHVPAGPARTVGSRGAVAVAIPSVVQALGTPRVPVQSGPTSLAYLKGAQWLDVPSHLFRDLLAETIAARTGRVVPDLRLPALAPDTRLSGRIEAFGIDASTNVAVVTFDAVLSREGSETVQSRRFETRVPVAGIDPTSVPPALNEAANKVAADVADWIGSGQP